MPVDFRKAKERDGAYSKFPALLNAPSAVVKICSLG
jgi:hypothetical protein